MKVLDLLRQRSLYLIHILLFLCHEVAANTEIITFSSSREPTVDQFPDVVGNWCVSYYSKLGRGRAHHVLARSTLCPTGNERRWSVEPAALHTPLHQVCERTDAPPFSCPYELWFFLDLDDVTWASYAVFTLRLSWAASVSSCPKFISRSLSSVTPPQGSMFAPCVFVFRFPSRFFLFLFCSRTLA